MGVLGSVGEHVTKEREKELEQKRADKGVRALELAYEKYAVERYAKAAVRGLVSWGYLGRGIDPGVLAAESELPMEIREGFDVLYFWWDEATEAAGRPHDRLTRSNIERAMKGANGKLGRVVLNNGFRPWKEQVEMALGAVEWYGKALDVIEEPGEETYAIGEDFEDSPLHEMYEKRREQGRSLQGIIVARDNDTGTGKTTLAVALCKKWGDDWGAENATNRPGEYRDFLNNKPEGSVLLADEIGQMFDSRRSMSSENVAVSQDWQMIRTKRYITLSTLPGPSFLDKRLKKLADVMILATRRGHARVYRLKVDDQEGGIWREHLCNVEWGPMDDDPDYQAVEKMKRDRLKERFEGTDGDGEGDDRGGWRDGRNETIRQLVENGMSQTEVAEHLNMDQSTVSRICREGDD